MADKALIEPAPAVVGARTQVAAGAAEARPARAGATAVVCDYHRYDSVVRVGSHHIARQLLRRGFELWWLAHPTTWLHRLRGRRPPEFVVHPDGVREVTLRAPVPYIDLPVLGSLWWGRRWLRSWPASRRALEALGLSKVKLLWLSDFTMLPVLDDLEAEHTVFRFFDHIQLFRKMPRSIFDLVRTFEDRATLMVASSRSVQEDLRRRGFESIYLPNGADPESFAAVRPAAERPVRRAVYVGALEEWFDLAAVEYWARHLPEVEFELVGPNRHRLRSRLPNVHFPGPLRFEALPELLSGAAVGIIPFKVNELTVGVHPLKLYDYLAAGCPVLSADLPEVESDPRGIFKYRSVPEGLGLLERLVRLPADHAYLQSVARSHSWQARLEPIWSLFGFDRRRAADGS